MYKLCLLVACLTCAGDGRRLKATLDEDVTGQKIMKQLKSSSGSRSHGQDKHSGSGQWYKSTANPRKVVPILLTFFSPAFVSAPSSNGLVFNNSIYNNTQKSILSNPISASAEPRVVMADQSYVKEAGPEVRGPSVRVVVSVGWEGLDLREGNLWFLKDFRHAHPDVPLTHFLCAAYFTKSEAQSMQEWSPYEALSPIDEVGIMLHGWKSLVEPSGVQYRSEPSVLQHPQELKKALEDEKGLRKLMSTASSEWVQFQNSLSQDVGYDTDIRAYSVDELQALISKSKVILEKHGFKVGKSFRAGAWLAGPNVLEAFRREGFGVNSSAIGFDELIAKASASEEEFWTHVPLSAMLRELWPDITKETQPFLLETPVGWVLEMPVTGGSPDYTTVKDMVDHIDSAVQQLDSEDRFVHIGLHQETAALFGPKVVAAITEIKRKHGHQVVFETLEVSARSWLNHAQSSLNH